MNSVPNKFLAFYITPPHPPSDTYPFGELTIGEIETELIHASGETDNRLKKYASKGGAMYPHVAVPTDISSLNYRNKPHSLLQIHSRKNLSFSTQIANLVPTAFREVFHQLNDYCGKAVEYIELTAYYVPYLQIFMPIRVPKSLKFTPQIPNDLPVRAFDWHPIHFRFAVALADQSIYFYDLMKEKWSEQVIRHDFHREISQIHWRPHSDQVLAVACKYGVCIWQLDKRLGNVGSVSENGVCMYLRVDGHAPISCMQWSPDGNLLVTSSERDHRVVVWTIDEETGKWSYKFLTRFNGGIRSLGFSPDGNYLAVFTITNVFRIWETMTWKTEKWKSVTPVKTFCWSSNSRYLLFVGADQSDINVLKFDYEPPKIRGEYAMNIDLRGFQYKFDDDGSIIDLCGNINEIAMDNRGKGERLVVTFEESNCAALMRCDFKSYFTKTPISPIGFISGPPDADGAFHLKFWPNFKKGALLSMCWNNGRISFYPLYYVDEIKR